MTMMNNLNKPKIDKILREMELLESGNEDVGYATVLHERYYAQLTKCNKQNALEAANYIRE